MVLELDNVSACYGSEIVVKGVTLSVEAGQIVVIVGRNGSGKTTLLKSIIGDVDLCSGRIIMHSNGEQMNMLSLSRRKRSQYVSMVEQQLPITDMQVCEYVALGRVPYQNMLGMNVNDADIRAIDKALELSKITHLSHRRLIELSGGERQLCAIARMIAQQTPIVLMDEPMSNLDVINQIEVASVMQILKQQGKIVLTVIHDLNMAFALADVVVIMKEGKVIATGNTNNEKLKNAISDAMNTEMCFFDVADSGMHFIVPRKWNKIF